MGAIVRPWWIKCAIQRALSHVPYGSRLNSLYSRRARLHSVDVRVLAQGVRIVRLLRALGVNLQRQSAMEVGTGWQPFLPYILRIGGCPRVVLSDRTRHLTPALLRATVLQLRGHAEWLARELDTTTAEVERLLPARLEGALEPLLEASGFEYRAPINAGQTGCPSASVDLITSHAVLEHVPHRVLPLYFAEMRRLLRPGGLMLHYIDHRDHWHHFDPGIGPLNFLKFSRTWWRVLNSPLAYQNRLRSAEYLRLIEEAGFEIRHLAQVVDGDALVAARTMQVAAEFRSYTPAELSVTSTLVIGQRAASAGSRPQRRDVRVGNAGQA